MAMTNNKNWWRCFKCETPLMNKLDSNDQAMELEWDGPKGQKYFGSVNFVIAFCPKCHTKNEIKSSNIDPNELEAFNVKHLSGDAWVLLANPNTKRIFEQSLNGIELKVYKEAMATDAESDKYTGQWIARAAKRVDIPYDKFFKIWGNIVLKIVEAEKKLDIDTE